MEGKGLRTIEMEMTDQEFDVLDELYFVKSFNDLKEDVEFTTEQLRPVLRELLSKKWIKCFFNMNDEVFEDQLNFEEEYHQYFYLATKAGLLAHNGV